MIGGLVPGSRGPGSSSVGLSKTLYSHSVCLRPGVEMGTGKLNAGGNPAVD